MRHESTAQRSILTPFKLGSCSLPPLERHPTPLHVHLSQTCLHLSQVHKRPLGTRMDHCIKVICLVHTLDHCFSHDCSASVQASVRILQSLGFFESSLSLGFALDCGFLGPHEVTYPYGKPSDLQVTMCKSLQVVHELHTSICSDIVVNHMIDRPVRFTHILLGQTTLEKHSLDDLHISTLISNVR